ncbi:MAG: SDR family NAD(P)-dependent oxidoreductase [Rhodospirillales bacterium]|nr:SDR family NAD(P)-dependent oxidoreductase [Rhodospirillales bacterium]
MPIDSSGKRCVWVTGASSGIGEALAKRLAADGYVVAVSARNADALAALADTPRLGRIVPFPLDVTDAAKVAETVEEIERHCGELHTAVLNAGTYQSMAATAFSADEARRQIDVNLGGIVNALEPLLERMCARQRGHIALVGSLTSRFGLPNAGVYGATKAALVNLAEALRVECARDGITIQIVNPGFVKTPLTDKNSFPMPFLVPVDRAAGIIAERLHGDRFEVAFPWQMSCAMGLLGKLPRFLAFAVTRRMVGS